jgi:hypothetical protein
MPCLRGCCETQADHYRAVRLDPSGTQPQTQFEKRLDKDRPAYKRLKDEGLQPARVSGAAELEKRAQSRWEIEAGRILPDSQAKRVDEAVQTAADVTRSV